MPQIWVWLQLLVGWLPMWALYATLMVSAHPGTPVHSAVFAGFRAVLCAALLGLVVHRYAQRHPWPSPMRMSFLVRQLIAAPVYAVSWVALALSLEVALVATHGGGLRTMSQAPLIPFLVLGVWMYAMVAGVSFATQATQRAAVAEAQAARAQLAALRTHLNPHFLFNALHTVVQLIPVAPRDATAAAEELAGLLRSSLEESRDLIPLADEWAFVSRYVALEQRRFGERLLVTVTIDDDALDALVPSFALQTLVENAVRHGAAPRIEPTTIHITAAVRDDALTLTVVDDGAGTSRAASPAASTTGTGLARLRDRLAALFGAEGTLDVRAASDHGFSAVVTVPFRDGIETARRDATVEG
jgi:hypothetical protein